MEVQISKGIIVDNYKNPENNFNYWLFFSFNEILIIDQTNFNENKHFFEKTNSLPSFFYLSEECKRDFLNTFNNQNDFEFNKNEQKRVKK